MKKELKISTLALTCVLCTAVVSTAFGAPAVRSLGGAGTYSSASNAATAKSSGKTGGTTVKTGSISGSGTRAGTLRVQPTSSTRVVSSSGTAAKKSDSLSSASSNRLSIGKYLANTGVTAKPNVGKESMDAVNASSGKLQERIVNLETLLGYDFDADKFNIVNGEIVRLKEEKFDIDNLPSDGFLVVDGNNNIILDVERVADAVGKDVEFVVEQGALKWVASDGTKTELVNLSNEYYTASDAAELVTDVNNAVTNITKHENAITTINETVSEIQDLLKNVSSTDGVVTAATLASVKDELVAADNAMDAAIKELPTKSYVTAAIGTLSGELKNLISGNTTSIESLKSSVASTYATLAQLGDLTKLGTENKSSLVDAINEVAGTVSKLTGTDGTDGIVDQKIQSAVATLTEAVNKKQDSIGGVISTSARENEYVLTAIVDANGNVTDYAWKAVARVFDPSAIE